MATDPEQLKRITTPDQRLRVFVSSTIGELEAERSVARAAIEQLRLTPIMFGMGARAHPAQDVYRAYLAQSDIFVGIYWQRYGCVGPGMTISGLEDEFRRSARLPRLLYFKRPAPDMEPALRQMLDEVRQDGGVAYKPFRDATELHELMLNDLATLLSERFGSKANDDWPCFVPSPVTTLVGRDHDVAEVVRLVQDQRLVVLTGAGGVGKTRLALAVITESREHWEDGVAFVDLSSVNDPQAVPDAIASSLGFVGQGRETALDTLGRRLASARMLLLLDNFEQVADAAPAIAGILERAPELHILVTSRVLLRIRGECEFRVDPLALVPRAAGRAELAKVPAIELFVERARAVHPGFELTDDNGPAIAEVCRRLDGLPLALELAAAWMRVLTPEQLLARLGEYMARPGGLVDLPDRQRTMTATVAWSYGMLAEPAQRLLARLSVFAAPFTADAAAAAGAIPTADATESLSTLLDHSMVIPATRVDGQPGFRLLEVIRHFASERIEDSDETLSRLEDYLLVLLEHSGFHHGAEDRARRWLDSEWPNVSVVIGWTFEHGRSAGQLLRRVGDQCIWLLIRGLLRGGSTLRRQVESWPATQVQSDVDRLALHWLEVQGLFAEGRYAEVGALLDQMLPDARYLEKPTRLGMLLMARGLCRSYEPESPALAEFEEALTVGKHANDPFVVNYARSHFGHLLCLDGDLTRARKMHEEMLEEARPLGDVNLLAEAHYDLGLDALRGSEPERAGPYLAFAGRHYVDIDNRDGLARCLAALSALALSSGDSHRAARLIGATEAARAIGVTAWPLVAEIERRFTSRVRDKLSPAEFAAEDDAGRRLRPERALEDALSSLEVAEPAPAR